MKHTQALVSERRRLLEQLKTIAQGLSETFAPFCEIVVHDLTKPKHSIVALYNNLSGRSLQHPATHHGLVRIADPQYPAIVANYANRFADGRQVKSTSIGIKDSTGRYVASLCLNIDLTLFNGLRGILDQFTAFGPSVVQESLDPAGADGIRARIDRFAAHIATTPRSLTAAQRRELVRQLKDSGYLTVRRSMEIIAGHLGVSRATIYTDAGALRAGAE